jgi:RNA polymerase sigma factor (sigma-70 family)
MNTFAITAQTKLKHAAVLRAVRKCGSIEAFAKYVGVSKSTAFKMVNMRWCMPAHPAAYWPQERIDSVKQAIADLSDESPQSLFPDELRASVLLNTFVGTIEQTKDIPLAGLLEYAESTQERLLLPGPSSHAETAELHDDLMKVVKTLKQREQVVIQMRWGIGEYHGHPHTLDEVAEKIKVTRERVRQIEAKAIRTLQGTSLAGTLIGHLD